MKTYFIKGISNDPYFNIASEQYLLENKEDFFAYIWINDPAVIVGAFQNTVEEVNLDYTERSGIKVVRRTTGGGAVYHDGNNVCYTVIAPYEKDRDNFRYFSEKVLGYLNSLGVKAEFSGRNDLTIDGKKFSGNAERIFKDRVMHHGTLLFDSDVKTLENALKPNKLKIQSKGIKSVRSRVTNLKEYLPNMQISDFYKGLCDYFSKGIEEYVFTQADMDKINRLVEDRYSRYEWNIGYSPVGTYFSERKLDCGMIKISFDLKEGLLDNVRFTGDFFSLLPIEELERELNGTKYLKSELSVKLERVGEYVKNAKGNEVLDIFFGV